MHVGGIGSIEKRGPNTWRIRLAVGKDPLTGKYRQKSRTVHGSKADAYRARDEMRRELEQGLRQEGLRLTFADFAVQFEARRRASGRFKDATLQSDHMVINRLNRYFGTMTLRDIDAFCIMRVQTRMMEDGYTPTMLHRTLRKLSQIMKDAARFDLITRNPCDKLDMPKPARRTIQALDAEGARQLARALESRERKAVDDVALFPARALLELARITACRLALSTGMRRGEVLGLIWQHVDFSHATIKIVQQYTSEGQVHEPKTRSGMRTISLDETTLRQLCGWKELQAQLLARLRATATSRTPVVANSIGGYSNVSDFNAWWKKLRTEAGFPTLRFHDLRHTQATLLIGNGVDIKTVQNRLGHARAATTLDTYACALPENDRQAAMLFDSILSS